jgi:transcriptional regulator with XRE-family HTH domain
MPNDEIICSLIKGFCERLCKLRKDKGLSQTELAKHLGYKAGSSVSKIESGDISPDYFVLVKIADVLNIDLHWLMVGKDSPKAEAWKEDYCKVLELLAGYVSTETVRLLNERRKLRFQLSIAEQEGAKGPSGNVDFLKSEISKIEQKIADVTEDQHYVQKALLHKS